MKGDRWGRAYRIAIWCVGVGTAVEAFACWAFVRSHLPAVEFTTVTSAYFLILTTTIAVAFGQNAAERLPGTRRFESRYPVEDQP